MKQETIPISLNGRVCLPGFRLKRLEILNWGTFCDEVHRIVPDARWSLLVGDNGSGKSTTADALRTLLVPPGRLSYNDASTDQKLKHQGPGKDRTKVTYIRGAFRAKSQEDSVVPILQFHREERVPSIILAVFTNEVLQSDVTLAQVHWVHENKSDQIYLVARADKTIKSDLSGLNPTARDIKKELKRRGFEPDDSFPAYEERFRRLLGIPGKNALEVFNQVIGVKEVKDLCVFVRRHMLEPSDARDFIDSHIRPNYVELNACWEAIKKAEAQLVLLNLVSANHTKLHAATDVHSELVALKQALPHFFNQQRLELREVYDQELDKRIGALTAEQESAFAEQKRLEEKKESINSALGATEEGQRLKDIDREIAELGSERDRRQKKLDKVREQFGLIGQSFPLQTAPQFDAMRRKLLMDRGPLNGNLEAQERKKMEHYLAKASAEKTRDELAREAQTVRDSGALIPRKFLDVRKQISAQTGVSEKDLPFAGELMEVKSDYRDWTGAIERLLRGLGTSMLVGERHYRTVADYINSTHLGIRLVFHQVPSVHNEARRDFLNDPKRVPARLSYLEDSPYIDWLKAEITRQFSHPCCETVNELRQASFGITKEGLIKDGTRHIKDDGSRISDRTNYVLGWSTQTKLAALIEEFQEAEKAATDHDQKFKSAVEHIKGISKRLSAIDMVLQFESFEEIDVASKTSEIGKLADEKAKLEAAENKLGQLKSQLRDVEKALGPARTAVSDVGERIGKEKGRKEDNQTAIVRLREALKSVVVSVENLDEKVRALPGAKTLSLDNVDAQAANADQQVGNRINNKAREMKEATEDLLPAMERFLNQYPQERATLKAGVEFGKDFVKLRDDIDGDELPKHRQRFFSLLNQKLILDMAALQTKLNNHETDIRQRIESVNQTLRHTRFSEDTYVHIRMTPANSDEIRKFKAELKECTARGIQPGKDDLERIYTKIRELIGRFEQEPEWTGRVIDARNWWDYGVQALFRANDKEAQYFAGSSGKSGGEKTILAFNILASAITAQYGLSGDGEDINRFRLVVVDEAFSKTDPGNSKRTMELFRALGLQLLVINPWDAKSRIVEDFVDTYHLAATDPETERSSLTRATRERYLEVQRAKDLERKAA